MIQVKKEICFMCNKHNLSFNEVGLCKKLFGRGIEKFMCMDCLADYLGVSTYDLLQKIEEFKGQGCNLFR